MKYLKQKGSGHIYVWSEALSQRDDMEPYDPTPKFETPTQNDPSRPPLPPIDKALEVFKRESKAGRKKGDA